MEGTWFSYLTDSIYKALIYIYTNATDMNTTIKYAILLSIPMVLLSPVFILMLLVGSDGVTRSSTQQALVQLEIVIGTVIFMYVVVTNAMLLLFIEEYRKVSNFLLGFLLSWLLSGIIPLFFGIILFVGTWVSF